MKEAVYGTADKLTVMHAVGTNDHSLEYEHGDKEEQGRPQPVDCMDQMIAG